MSVTILFFAQLREQLDCEKMEFVIAHALSVNELRSQLVNLNPRWAIHLHHPSLLFSVNHSLVKAGHLVHDGDEVAFFPPVTGG